MNGWIDSEIDGDFCQGDFQLQIVERLSRVTTGRDEERFHFKKKKNTKIRNRNRLFAEFLPKTVASCVSN